MRNSTKLKRLLINHVAELKMNDRDVITMKLTNIDNGGVLTFEGASWTQILDPAYKYFSEEYLAKEIRKLYD